MMIVDDVSSTKKLKTFSDVLRDKAQKRPDHVAILEPERNISVTYKELDDLVDRVAIWLDSNGVKQGGVVSVVIKNCPFEILKAT